MVKKDETSGNVRVVTTNHHFTLPTEEVISEPTRVGNIRQKTIQTISTHAVYRHPETVSTTSYVYSPTYKNDSEKQTTEYYKQPTPAKAEGKKTDNCQIKS